MADKKELNEDELGKVNGGMFTPEAQAWDDQNREDILSNAYMEGKDMGAVDNMFEGMKNDAGNTYGVDDLRTATINAGVSLDPGM